MKITLENLHEATAQEVFDQVAIHLLTQKKESILDYRCMYRAGELMCAAGCLIGENEYNAEKMENFNWETLVCNNIVPLAHHALICELQRIHDTIMPYRWAQFLRLLAAEYRLSPAVVEVV